MRAALAVTLVMVSVPPAWAQAWLPAKGETTLSLVWSDSYVKEHDLNGVRDPRGRIDTQSTLADITYGLRDDLSLTLSIPMVRGKFTTLGTPPHPTALDNGQYHSTLADVRFDVRYNLFKGRTTVVTPYITALTPSHNYEYFAHAAPGRRVSELQLGAAVGTTLDRLHPGTFLQARYGYGLQERFLDISHNKSVFSVESGYFVTPDVRVFGSVNGQRTHGGVDLRPDARLVWPAAQWLNHDRITRENVLNVGGGIGWSVNDTVDVFASYSKAVQARNTHVLDRALVFGASIRLQRSALERGLVSSSLGQRVARCACEKGLAARH